MPITARRIALPAACGAVALGAWWWRTHPSACPYAQRFWVEAPHPLITRARLRGALAPMAGEHVLELGPGTGYYTLDLAEWLSPGGTLEIFDIQPQMLDHTMARARERGLDNIVATQGDARNLPYADATFDAACMVAVLGEIPEPHTALRELARVLASDGRVVVGELAGDPHWVSPRRLRDLAGSAGLRLVSRTGTPLGYFATLRPVADVESAGARA